MNTLIVAVHFDPTEYSEQDVKAHVLALLDAHLKHGHYALHTGEPEQLPVVDTEEYKDITQLNIEIRSLALRTLQALEALGIGQRTALYRAWRDLATGNPISTKLDAELRKKLNKLEELATLIGKAEEVIDSFNNIKAELDRTWDAIERVTR